MSQEKIQVTTTPALPSKCAVCQTMAKGITRFIDFGEDLDFYGAIVICELCVVNAAEQLGTLVPVAKFKSAEATADNFLQRLREANEKVDALESLIAAYGFGRHLDFSPDSGSDLPLPLGEADQDDNAGSDSASEPSESGPTEPATV